jgi:hypothetical protein
MTVKPGSGNRPAIASQYKICNSIVNTSARIDTSGSGTYPNEAVYKTRLDEQREDPAKPPRSLSFT